MEIRDRRHVLRLHAKRSHEGTLLAPVDGAMERRIAESIDARIGVRLEDLGGRLLFEGSGANAGLEIVGDTSLIGVRAAPATRPRVDTLRPGRYPGGGGLAVNDRIIDERYRVAQERYAELGVDTDRALETLAGSPFPSTAGRGTTWAGSRRPPPEA